MSDYEKYKKNRELLKKYDIKIKFLGTNGEDIAHKLNFSYSYNGVPCGWYIKNKRYNNNSYYKK